MTTETKSANSLFLVCEEKKVSTKKRKQRTVKGGYIDLDDVKIESGESYENWIFYAKIKLKERETKLMEIRTNKIKQTILENIKIFENDNQYNNNNNIIISKTDIIEYIDNKLNNNLISSTMGKLNEALINWRGIRINGKKKGLSSFREYFGGSRNWFDQRKKKIKGSHFWVEILSIIQQFALKAAANFIDDQYTEIQCKFYHHLLRQIMYGILSETITFTATKPQPLLPSGIVKEIKCIKQLMSDFFGKYLDVDQIIIILKQENRLSAKNLRLVIIQRLQELLEIAKMEFNDIMNASYSKQHEYNQVNYNQVINQNYDDLYQSEYQYQSIYQYDDDYNQYDIEEQEPILFPFNNNNNNDINSCPFLMYNEYNNNNNNNNVYHTSYQRLLSPTQSVKDVRYHPY